MSLHIYPEPRSVAVAAAQHIARVAEVAQATRGHFTLVLAGGSTPRAVYELLASDEFQARIDWAAVYVFFGDERCVPPEHPDSNYHMARQTLLDFVPIPVGHIFRMQGELLPEQAASTYESSLRSFFDARHLDQPRFDLVLLGMGDDAHTASLFPDTPALQERVRWVAAQYVDRLAAWRLTLTPPALNAAKEALFLVTGTSKAPALAAVLDAPRDPRRYPAQLVQPQRGALHWFVDAAAAAGLPPPRG